MWLAPRRTTRGGQPRYSDLAIETALMLGLVLGLRLRQVEGLLGSVLPLMGLALAVPDCQEFCAVGRFHQLKNRSPKMTANCVFASTHSRGARFHCSAALLRTSVGFHAELSRLGA